MTRPRLLATRTAALGFFAAFAAPLATFAAANSPSVELVPTLDGAGLASLAGLVSVTGAWWLSRGRGKRK